jgi:hypothetical protein
MSTHSVNFLTICLLICVLVGCINNPAVPIISGITPTTLQTSTNTLTPTHYPTSTHTPTPTHTPTYIPTNTLTSTPTLTPTPALGNDIEEGCIWSNYWAPYPDKTYPIDDRGCWDLEKLRIFAQSGGLHLAEGDSKGNSPTIYFNISDIVDIAFTVKIDKLTTNPKGYSYLAFGIGNLESGLTKGYYLVFHKLSPEMGIDTVIKKSVYSASVEQWIDDSPEDGTRVVFSISNEQLTVIIDNKVKYQTNYLYTMDRQVFFIGFNLPVGEQIDTLVTDIRKFEK